MSSSDVADGSVTLRRPVKNNNDDDDSDSGVSLPLASGSRRQSPLDFVEWGPPPDMSQRELIFDSLNKIVGTQPQKANTYGANKSQGSAQQLAAKGDSRGTYVFTWGAGSVTL